ncbi:MAG: hypothetical protein KDE48_09325, partial [Anaerolineales bacterium]|nr:hypothetical protein [Anaerolineales bacterium]
MDQFTSAYLTSLATTLSKSLLPALTSRMQKALRGTAQDQALARALAAGIIALLAVASEAEPDEIDHLDGIFRRFFAEPDVTREIAQILRGHGLDMDEMRELFAEAGYDEETLPKLDFETGMNAFQAA